MNDNSEFKVIDKRTKGYTTIENYILKDREKFENCYEKLIYIVLLSYTNSADEQKECYPSLTTLCNETFFSRATVVKAINSLIKKGFIEKIKGDSKTSNIYIIHDIYKPIKECNDNSTPIQDKEPKKENRGKERKVEDNSEKENKFNEFWEIYDKKKGKANAIKHFMKLDLQTIELVIQTAKLYVKDTPEKQYRKDPERFISQKIYLDYEDKIEKNTKKELTMEEVERIRAEKEEELNKLYDAKYINF